MHDLISLKAFCALCEYQSLTATAKYLKQPKSTLSRRLSQLEVDVGQALITRQGNRLLITKAGELFAEYCQQILDIAEQGVDALQELNNEISGELKIVVHNNLIRGWLNESVAQFLELHPKVSISLISQFTPNNQDLIPDIVVWVGDYKNIDYRCEKLGHWYYRLYASPEYLSKHDKISHPKDIKKHDWVNYITHSKSLYHPEHGLHLIDSSQSRLHSDNITVQLDAIANGRGIGLLPIGLATKYGKIHPGKIEVCLPEWHTPAEDINCYYAKGRRPLRESAFIQKIKKTKPAHWDKK